MAEGREWVFLGGCTNSGTGLVRILLNRHPEISVLPKEGPKLTKILPDDDRLGLPPRLFGLYPEAYHLTEKDLFRFDFVRILSDWQDHLDINKTVFFEKCPANATRMRLFQAAFDNTYFIGIVRNPYAVCEGIKRRRLHAVGLCARHWVAANRQMLDDSNFLHRFMVVRYEDLVERTADEMSNILKFIGLTGNIEIDGSEIIQRHNLTNKPQPIQNFNETSLLRLSKDEVEIISNLAWPLANLFGYSMVIGDL